MTVLRATNGNIQLSAGTLGSLPSGAWWVAAIVRRRGTTTDGIEAVTAIVDGGSVISSLYVDADTAPWGIYVGHGGFESTFAGLGTYGDDEFILIFAQKPAGDATPRANVFDGEDWVGWQTGSQEFEDRGDTIDAAWMINMPGGFPWNGDIAVVAWGAGNLAEADVTDSSIGLHIGVQQWLDAGPAVLWRAANPVVDESGNSPAADEVSRSGITMVDEAPAWFNMEFGGGAVDITPADATHAHEADQPALAQTHAVVTQGATHAHTADAATVTQAHAVAPADATHGHVADTAAITQTHALTPADGTHAHAADSSALTQVHELAVDDTLHAHAADEAALTGAGDLAVHDAGHGHTADAPTLTQVHELAPADATHAHTADAADVTTGHAIEADSAGHAHAASSPTIAQVHLVAVAAATHAHTAEQAALTQLHLLLAADATHAHSADAAAVSEGDLSQPGPRLVTQTAPGRLATAGVPGRITTQTGGRR